MTTPNIPTYDAWRSMTQYDKRLFIGHVTANLNDRWDMGEEKYDSAVHGFQGFPLQHAYEEWQDLGVYLYYIKRYIQDLHMSLLKSGAVFDSAYRLSDMDWGRDN